MTSTHYYFASIVFNSMNYVFITVFRDFNIYVSLCMHLNACVNACMYLCMHASMYACMYLGISIQINVLFALRHRCWWTNSHARVSTRIRIRTRSCTRYVYNDVLIRILPTYMQKFTVKSSIVFPIIPTVPSFLLLRFLHFHN